MLPPLSPFDELEPPFDDDPPFDVPPLVEPPFDDPPFDKLLPLDEPPPLVFSAGSSTVFCTGVLPLVTLELPLLVLLLSGVTTPLPPLFEVSTSFGEESELDDPLPELFDDLLELPEEPDPKLLALEALFLACAANADNESPDPSVKRLLRSPLKVLPLELESESSPSSKLSSLLFELLLFDDLLFLLELESESSSRRLFFFLLELDDESSDESESSPKFKPVSLECELAFSLAVLLLML